MSSINRVRSSVLASSHIFCTHTCELTFAILTFAVAASAASFAEIRKVRHHHQSERVRIIKKKRILKLDMHAQKIKPDLLRIKNVFFETFDVSRRVNTFRIIRLVQRPAQITRYAI